MDWVTALKHKKSTSEEELDRKKRGREAIEKEDKEEREGSLKLDQEEEKKEALREEEAT